LATKYEEMCDAAHMAQAKQDEYQHRCFRHMTSLFKGFLSYCGIPQERVTLLRWNGLAGKDSMFTVPRTDGPDLICTWNNQSCAEQHVWM
jgi:hypothetical protein